MRQESSERGFDYFIPAGRRASVYEDVTVDTQPSVQRHLSRGWLTSFEGGAPMWDAAGTALVCNDWFAFRDPAGLWERPYYQQGAASEAEIERTVRSAREDRLWEGVDPDWIAFLRETLQVEAFLEHGLWLVTATVARAALSDSITHCLVFEAAMKQRQAQALVLYGLDLEAVFGDFDIAGPKRRWLEDPAWQPTRELVEALRNVRDFSEAIVAVNLCLEPLVGLFARRELLLRPALAAGDPVTPTVLRAAQMEWEWTRAWSAAWARFLASDEEHGGANREQMETWIARWRPHCEEAAEALEGAYPSVPGRPFADALASVWLDADALLADAELAATEAAR